MAQPISSLFVELAANTAKLQQDMGRASRIIEQNARKWDQRFQALSRSFGAVFAGLSVAGLAQGVREVTRFADTLANAADRVGISVEQLQALRAEAEKVGLSYEATDTAVQRFGRRLAEARLGTGTLAKVLDQYNITLRTANGRQKSVAESLEDFRTVLASIDDQAERNRVSMAAFDTEGVKLGQTLTGLGGSIDETTAKLLEQGRVMEEDAVRAAAALETSWTEAIQKANTLWRRFVVNVIQGWQTIITGFDMSQISESVIPGMNEINQQIIDLQEKLDQQESRRGRNRTAATKVRIAELKGELEQLQAQREELIAIAAAERKRQREALGTLPIPGDISAKASKAAKKCRSCTPKQTVKAVQEADAHVQAYQRHLEDAAEETQRYWQRAGSSVGDALGRMIEGSGKATDAVKALIAELASLAAKYAITKFVLPALGLTAAASGLSMPGGSTLSPGVYTRPTLFKFANGGNLGLMAEAGAEAVLPLTRTSSGKLGVEATGGAVNVSIANYAAADGYAATTRPGMNPGDVEVVIARIGEQISRGGNHLARSFERAYSLSRGR